MPQRSKDLFDDTVMTFGEHLEALRIHLFKALVGVVLAMIFCLYHGDVIVAIVRQPLDHALKTYGRNFAGGEDGDQPAEKKSSWGKIKQWTGLDTLFGSEGDEAPADEPPLESDAPAAEAVEPPDTMTVQVSAAQIARALHDFDAEQFPLPAGEAANGTVSLQVTSPLIRELKNVVLMSQRPVTLNVQEGFMMYLKLSFVGGLIVASPWVFYQVWMFIAAGLYPHERKYVYLYGGLSLALFLIGVVFCYYLVFPFVLRFLVSFNADLELVLQARLSEWVSFAILLPVMFGVSFQLPLVMLFLERLQILETQTFIDQRRMAILLISILSMVLTPADPISMLLMMFPLMGLYELGILLCRRLPGHAPEDEPAAG
ncbi:MAG: twin-arginine translocase subunit TatC [Planctomyces sp.]|nr:twin-arginine translocase subunit TatC [Planctomyces sp.]